jgi:hypothetical protein
VISIVIDISIVMYIRKLYIFFISYNIDIVDIVDIVDKAQYMMIYIICTKLLFVL